MAIETIAELRSLSMEELIEQHDALAQRVAPHLDYYRNEIQRREQAKITETIRNLTLAIAGMTFVMLVAVIVQVVVSW